jgi:hypothetical protein
MGEFCEEIDKIMIREVIYCRIEWMDVGRDKVWVRELLG